MTDYMKLQCYLRIENNTIDRNIREHFFHLFIELKDIKQKIHLEKKFNFLTIALMSLMWIIFD